MTRNSFFVLLCFCMWVPFGHAAGALDGKPDYEREKRLDNEIRETIFDGEVVDLDANGRSFMGIHLEPEGNAKGAVIILHGRGYHPNWEHFVYPLRLGLAESGWHTLSLQMPVLHKAAKYYDYVPLFAEAGPRINAGIRYLKELGIDKVVLAAHSCGVHMAMHWIEEQGDGELAAFIGAGMGATDYKQPMLKEYPLDKMTVPVLDVFGADEHSAVLREAPNRKAAIEKAGNPLSAQKILPDSDHYFTGVKEPLVELVSSWLETLH